MFLKSSVFFFSAINKNKERPGSHCGCVAGISLLKARCLTYCGHLDRTIKILFPAVLALGSFYGNPFGFIPINADICI